MKMIEKTGLYLILLGLATALYATTNEDGYMFAVGLVMFVFGSVLFLFTGISE